MRVASIHLAVGLTLLVWWMAGSHAAINWSVAINDPASTYQAYYAPIQSNLSAALSEWSTHLISPGTRNIQIEVDFTNSVTRATGYSATSVFTQTTGGVNVFEQAVAAEIRTGVDPNGSAPDMYIKFQPTYLSNELWFDPNPLTRSTPVPLNRTDAYSVLLHEVAHAIGFNGWRDATTGAVPGAPPYESTFDKYEVFDGANLFFRGPSAMALYGGPVPVTFGNNFHLGNNSPRPGSDLIPDLMNGVVFFRGTRYDISMLDLAVLSDAGVLVVVPEPSSLIPFALGLTALVFTRRRKRHHNRINSCGPSPPQLTSAGQSSGPSRSAPRCAHPGPHRRGRT